MVFVAGTFFEVECPMRIKVTLVVLGQLVGFMEPVCRDQYGFRLQEMVGSQLRVSHRHGWYCSCRCDGCPLLAYKACMMRGRPAGG